MTGTKCGPHATCQLNPLNGTIRLCLLLHHPHGLPTHHLWRGNSTSVWLNDHCQHLLARPMAGHFQYYISINPIGGDVCDNNINLLHATSTAPLGHYIIVEFRDQFNIEEAGNDCDNDKIEIRDGRFGYSKVLARYCGNKFPPEVKSSNEAMWLRFISDGSITHNGFKAVYKFEKQKGKSCWPFHWRPSIWAQDLPGPFPVNKNTINTNSLVFLNLCQRNNLDLDLPGRLSYYTHARMHAPPAHCSSFDIIRCQT